MDIAPKYTLGLLFAASGRGTVSFQKLYSLPEKNSAILTTAKKKKVNVGNVCLPCRTPWNVRS